MKFRKKSIIIELEQYHNIPNGWPKGVCAGCEEIGLTLGPHVHTAHNNQAVELEDGDWIAPEPDGVHFYPIKADIFATTFEAVGNGCGVCGGALTEIRSRYPGEPKRTACPTCLADRMDQIRQVADADYGRACVTSFAVPAGLKSIASTLLIITLLLYASVVSHAQTGALGNPPTFTDSGPLFTAGTWTTIARPAAIIIRSDGKIICQACKDVPPDAVIGTLTDAARNEMFPAITVPPTPKSPFSGITIGSDNLTRYNHARRTVNKSDFFRSFGLATIISTSICGVGQASDIISSAGYEGNAFLRGSDGRMNRAKATPLKLGACALPLIAEKHVPRKVRIVLRGVQIGMGALGFYDAAKNWKVNR